MVRALTRRVHRSRAPTHKSTKLCTKPIRTTINAPLVATVDEKRVVCISHIDAFDVVNPLSRATLLLQRDVERPILDLANPLSCATLLLQRDVERPILDLTNPLSRATFYGGMGPQRSA